MAANKGQGRSFAVFLVGLTMTCAGIADWSGGPGKPLLAAGLVVMAASFAMSLGLKPLEGKPAHRPGGEGAKLGGALAALLGWLVTLVGVHVASGTGARLALALLGIATSLYGIVVVLPAGFNRNAIWKA